MPVSSVSRKRDPDASRQRILAAATEEFATKGFGDARVDEIARRAGINKRMLYHYFGNKDDLFRAALEEIYETICVVGQSLNLDAMAPRDGLVALVDFVWEYYLENPESMTLLNTENLHGARHLRESDRARAMHPPFESVIENLLRRGVATGEFRPGINPAELYITIVGLVYYYLSNNATLSIAFGRDLRAPKQLKHWRQHVRDVISRFVIELPITSSD
jgi:AcrR family transcriptional regulator